VVEKAKGWIKENQALVLALIAQAIIAGAYMVNLESRVSTLETRGSPHLADINTRLTVLEGMTRTNKDTIDRVVDIMTKELHVSPQRTQP
jgi:hypothetical protein